MTLAFALALLMSGPVIEEAPGMPVPGAPSIVYADGVKIMITGEQRVRMFSPTPPSKKVQLVIDGEKGAVVSVEAERFRVETENTVSEISIGDDGRLVIKTQPVKTGPED